MSIGKRLEQFAISEYGGISNLNKAINDISGKRTSIYKYIHDERTPGSSLLAPLASLDCNINWLLTGKGEMLISRQVTTNDKLNKYILEVYAHLDRIQEILEEMYEPDETEVDEANL